MNFTRTQFGVSISGAGPSCADLPIRHIIGVGRNYAEHAQELGNTVPDRPLLFTKNLAALCLSGDEIVIPKVCQDRPQVDYEGELAFVIGKPAKDVPIERALDFVLGYCIANDVSARWWQKEGSGGQFYRGKSFDTFCPIGPMLTPVREVRDPQALTLMTRLNNAEVQRESTGTMIYTVAQLIAEMSRGATLLPGTLVLTGTPSGVGAGRKPPLFIKDGDTVEVEISGLGKIVNRVREER